MDVREVRECISSGQVVKAPKYHAGRRGISFMQLLAALATCCHVAPDDRPQHPNGWYALANLPGRRRLRIDFDVHRDASGALLLVVTAYDA